MFTQRDNAEMRKAANFMWVSETSYFTYGVTQNLVLTVHGEWLHKVIDKIISGRVEYETDNEWLERQLEGR